MSLRQGVSQEDLNSDEVKEDELVSVVTEVDAIDSEDDVIVEVADELISEEETPGLPKNERDVRESIGVPSKGVMYGISASRFTAGIDVDEAIASFDPSSASSAPSGTAWVRMAPWVSVPKSIEQPWIVTTAGDTTWVAEYPGCVADYLRSLDLVRALDQEVLYPAHGEPLENPREAIDRFAEHRRGRIEQVRRAMSDHPESDIEGWVDTVYGAQLPDTLRGAAYRSLSALVDYVRDSDKP